MAKQNLDELLEQAEEKIEKGEELDNIETEHHGKEKLKVKTQKSKVEEEIKSAKMGEGEKPEEIIEEAKEEKTAKDIEKPKKKEKKGQAKIRSQKYQDAKALIDANKKYDIEEGIELVKKTSYTKFDGKVEVHIRLLGKSGKPEQLRGLIQYPHATGKKMSVVVLDDKTIEEIAKTGKVDADIYLTTPADMPKVAKLAKILGPKGKMPNPKSGTITDNIEKTKKDLEGGQTEYKTDNTGNLHQVIGKVSAETKSLTENYRALISLLPKEKIVSIHLTATMGPGIKVVK